MRRLFSYVEEVSGVGFEGRDRKSRPGLLSEAGAELSREYPPPPPNLRKRESFAPEPPEARCSRFEPTKQCPGSTVRNPISSAIGRRLPSIVADLCTPTKRSGCKLIQCDTAASDPVYAVPRPPASPSKRSFERQKDSRFSISAQPFWKEQPGTDSGKACAVSVMVLGLTSAVQLELRFRKCARGSLLGRALPAP